MTLAVERNVKQQINLNLNLGVKVGFEAFSEGDQRGGRTNLPRKSIPNSGSIKSKAITKLFDRFRDWGLKLGNDKVITTTLTAHGTVGTAVVRDVWSKILGKTSVE